jgi:hypothetical protein
VVELLCELDEDNVYFEVVEVFKELDDREERRLDVTELELDFLEVLELLVKRVEL